MNVEQARALREPFENVQQVTKRWKDKETGQPKSVTLDYIGHAVVTDRLLRVDPGYEFRPLLDDAGRPIVVLEGLGAGDSVGVWGELIVLGTSIVEFCSGKDLLDAYSRCLCRAAMRRGVALDLWIKDDEFKDKGQAPERRINPQSLAVPKSWKAVEEPITKADNGETALEMWRAFVRAAAYHLFGETETAKLTKEQKAVLFQKAAGAVVYLVENYESEMADFVTYQEEDMRAAFAQVMDGAVLEIPDYVPPEEPVDPEAEEIERLARLADESITGPPE